MSRTGRKPKPQRTGLPDLSYQLRKRRLEADLTLRELEKRIDVPFWTLHKSEHGRLRFSSVATSTFIKLCRFLNVESVNEAVRLIEWPKVKRDG